MKKFLSILAAIGVGTTGASSVVSCAKYKSVAPIEYKKFTDFNTKNFNRLGEGKVLILDKELKPDQNPGDKTNTQAISDYLEKEGSGEVKRLAASPFQNYGSAYDVLKPDTMKIRVVEVSPSTTNLLGSYQAKFRIVDDDLKRISETLSLVVVPKTTTVGEKTINYQTFKTDAGFLVVPDNINSNNSVFKKTFISTANFLLSINDNGRRNDLINNGILDQNWWNDSAKFFTNQYANKLRNGVTDGKTSTYYLPGQREDNKQQYLSLEAQIMDSNLGAKNLRAQLAAEVSALVLNLVNQGVITHNNQDQIKLYQLPKDEIKINNLQIVNNAPKSTN